MNDVRHRMEQLATAKAAAAKRAQRLDVEVDRHFAFCAEAAEEITASYPDTKSIQNIVMRTVNRALADYASARHANADHTLLEYAFAVSQADGYTSKFSVMLMENGFIRIRTSDKNGAADHIAQWTENGWQKCAGRRD